MSTKNNRRWRVTAFALLLFSSISYGAPASGGIYGSGTVEGVSKTVSQTSGAVSQALGGVGKIGGTIGQATGQVTGVVNQVAGQVTGAVNQVTGQVTGAINGALGSISGITGAIGSITGIASSIQGVIAQISSITGIFSSIFDSFNLDSLFDQVTGNNNLLACVSSGLGVDKASLVEKFGFDIKGICSLAGLGGKDGGGFDLGSIADCLGGGGNLGSSLSSLCARASRPEAGGIGGGSGGSGAGAGGGGENAGGAPSGEIAGSSTIDPASIAIIDSSVGDEIKINTSDEEPVKPEDIKFKGISGKELWKTGGGYINKKTREKPGSSTAQANLNFDVPVLVLKEKALQESGDDSLARVGLPATKADMLEREDQVAQFVADGIPDLHLEGDSLAVRAREKFMDIKADSLSEYYSKEAAKFKEVREKDEKLNALYDVAKKVVAAVYAKKLFALTRDPDYVFDPSMSRAMMIDPKYRADYIFASLHQAQKETEIKTQMALEMKKQKILLDIMAQRAYVSASVFRSDIAKKEIDDMLKAIDQTIK